MNSNTIYICCCSVCNPIAQHTRLVSSNRLCYIGLQTHFWLQTCLPRITHTFIWLPVSFVLPNHKQFIRVNRMLCVAHSFIWLPVSFVPTHHKQLIELNYMPFIAHATKIWTVFDASVIANVLHLFWRFFTPSFAIMASHTVLSKVSDRSVTFGPSCSSVS